MACSQSTLSFSVLQQALRAQVWLLVQREPVPQQV
jgi:hypothetical protein